MRVCVACKSNSIDKLSIIKAAFWGDVVCSKCNARLKKHPTGAGLLAVTQYIFVFCLLFLAYIHQSWLYVVGLVVLWFTLEVVAMFFMPLVEKTERTPE